MTNIRSYPACYPNQQKLGEDGPLITLFKNNLLEGRAIQNFKVAAMHQPKSQGSMPSLMTGGSHFPTLEMFDRDKYDMTILKMEKTHGTFPV